MATERPLNPPYVAFRTFQTFLESLALGMPNRIDRSLFDSKFSGTATSQILSALRSLELINGNGTPSDALRHLVDGDDTVRKSALTNILKQAYGYVFELDLEHATKQQLREAMRRFGCTDTMLVKCEAFFIHAATYAGIPLSPYLTSNRKSGTRPRTNHKSSKTIPTATSNGNETNLGTDTVADDVRDEFLNRVLDKFPDFDPSWPEETQLSWMQGMVNLQNALMLRTQDIPNETNTQTVQQA